MKKSQKRKGGESENPLCQSHNSAINGEFEDPCFWFGFQYGIFWVRVCASSILFQNYSYIKFRPKYCFHF